MYSEEIRWRFLEFFKKREHKEIPSASLVPENDPTTLFTGSGMQPLLPYLLGEKHPDGKRLVNSQKSFRAEDIDEVGDNRHTTFFEMLGNWSLGAYWKEEQLEYFFTFLTKELRIQKDRLWVTCFEGDSILGLPKDTESAEIWKKLGIPEEQINFYGGEKNWWNRGKPSPETTPIGDPAGPDSEVFFDFKTKHSPSFGERCHPNCDCGRFMEIGNSVFMQYVRRKDKSFQELAQKNVDFGGGLERLTAAANDNPDIFEIDIFKSAIREIEKVSSKSFDDKEHQSSFRIIADHVRAAMFMIADGVIPSNTEQGYFVRRLLRRAGLKIGKLCGEDKAFLAMGALVHGYANVYKKHYPVFTKEKIDEIDKIITDEETKFCATLGKGLREFEKMSSNNISGRDAFTLFSTYGFPLELTLELAQEQGITVDIEEFKQKMEKHQEISRAGAEKKFKGGLADTSEMSVKYHTATHLLHQALRSVLGDSVLQKGSNITPERLRFDFAFERKMTEEEKQNVEDIVNQKIKEALPVTSEDISIEEARRRGAVGLFEEKYGELVRVYKIGDTLAGSGKIFSLEFCGGPHVKNTADLGGTFKIIKEEAVSSGARRIKAVLV